MNAKECIAIFDQVVKDYHVHDDINHTLENRFEDGLNALLYRKCSIDSVQWHLEDLVRDEHIDPVIGMEYKRRIDRLNQKRNDTVEKIDEWLIQYFGDKNNQSTGLFNTESPAWAVDRLSILSLKIYHMNEEVERSDASENHVAKCQHKLSILKELQFDLGQALDQLLIDISEGKRAMKVYRQMKMYNDEQLNPVLYKKD